jgi:hypothetical protein
MSAPTLPRRVLFREETVSPNEHRRLRHARIKEILFEVSSLAGCARMNFLDAACSGDQELRDEVESLLSYYDARLDGIERAEHALPGPARDPREPGETATVSEADRSTPTNGASGKAARRARRKSSP